MNFIEPYFLELIIDTANPQYTFDIVVKLSLISHKLKYKMSKILQKHKEKLAFVKSCEYNIKYNFTSSRSTHPMFRIDKIKVVNKRHLCYLCQNTVFNPIITSFSEGYYGYFTNKNEKCKCICFVFSCMNCAKNPDLFQVLRSKPDALNLELNKMKINFIHHYDIDTLDKFISIFNAHNYSNIIKNYW
jgi:hypothetical protein